MGQEEEVKRRIDAYFEKREEEDLPPTWEGLALALDTTKFTLSEWMRRGDERGQSIQKAKQKCEVWIADRLVRGKIPPIGAIFTLKNNYGWRDEKNLDITTKGESIKDIKYVTPTEAHVLDDATKDLLTDGTM